jgi:hypothetical protein
MHCRMGRDRSNLNGRAIRWDVQDTSTSEFAYRLFSVDGTPVAGPMELPLDGTVYVPPTDSNIGRLDRAPSIVGIAM